MKTCYTSSQIIDLAPYYDCSIMIHKLKENSCGESRLSFEDDSEMKLVSCSEQVIYVNETNAIITEIEIIGYSCYCGYQDWVDIVDCQGERVSYNFYLNNMSDDEENCNENQSYMCKKIATFDFYDDEIIIKNKYIYSCKLSCHRQGPIKEIRLPYNPNIYIIKIIMRFDDDNE